jgi:hypothetical protein
VKGSLQVSEPRSFAGGRRGGLTLCCTPLGICTIGVNDHALDQISIWNGAGLVSRIDKLALLESGRPVSWEAAILLVFPLSNTMNMPPVPNWHDSECSFIYNTRAGCHRKLLGR